MDINEVKSILQIKTDRHDEYLSTIVPMMLELAEEMTNNTFNSSIPGPVKVFVAKACEYNMKPTGLEARTMGDVSYNYETDLPPSLTKLLRPYKKVRFR